MQRRHFLQGASALALGSAAWGGAVRAAVPATVRIGVAQPALGTPPGFYGSSVAIAHAKGWMENELKAEGVRVEWIFFKGAGPAVNEALTNQQLDFALQGDLPSIIGRAGGLKTRLLAAAGVRSNLYLAVPPGSSIQSVRDLQGKRVSIFKGTNGHLPIERVLEAARLTEKDLRAINLDSATSRAALATRDIDAAFGGVELLQLRNQGQARIVYSSKEGPPIYTRQSHLLVTERFAAAQPEITQRVVQAVVKSAHWCSDEANREEIFRIWGRTGFPAGVWREDYQGASLSARFSPRFDPFLRDRYRDAVEQAVRFKLIRRSFDTAQWIDARPVERALQSLNLQSRWPEYSPNGQQVAG